MECFAYYIGFLKNEGVPEHKQKVREDKYINKVDNGFEIYKAALAQNDIDWKILKFTDVNDQIVGYIHRYFLQDMKYANKTYNNMMSILSAFTSHVISKFTLSYKSPFLGVPDLIVRPKVNQCRKRNLNNS